ncbi:DUF2591 family protein [Proteus mirabilis]|nr:DUF2591 family protein [Proteus mirabilis]
MNKYRDKSDFEINKAVAEKHGYHWYWSNTVGKPPIMVNGYIFDPCNNPSDAMPIIIENKIAINPKGDTWQCGSGWNVAENKNPLRTCMEVFLMTKDAEN